MDDVIDNFALKHNDVATAGLCLAILEMVTNYVRSGL